MNNERKENFLHDLYVAQNSVVGYFEFTEKSSDPNGLLAESRSKIYERAAFWLHAKHVNNYSYEDWNELPHEIQEELDNLVDKFKCIIGRFDPQTCPSKEDYNTALPIFIRICEIVQPSKII